MPELPEVETIKTQLSHYMPLQIQSVELSKVAGSIVHTPLEKLENVLIQRIWRKGKMLVFELSSKKRILSHLGMTGSWRVSEQALNEKHAHIKIICAKGDQKLHLSYVDPRRFGHLYLLDEKESQRKLSELGADLKSQEFSFEYFKNALNRYPQRLIKVTLLDQSLFAGTGNYIANEICARAGVLPHRKVEGLTAREVKRLYEAVFQVIDGAIDTGGTTFQGGYSDVQGDKGQGVQNLVVFYQKVCRLCSKTPVVKTTLAQRGTYHCPKCQK